MKIFKKIFEFIFGIQEQPKRKKRQILSNKAGLQGAIRTVPRKSPLKVEPNAIINSNDASSTNEEIRLSELNAIAASIESKLIVKDQFNHDRQYLIKYQEELNQQQLTAVTITNIPLLVIAGAGSGKTRVITFKVSYLIENGIDPSKILLLTFTKKAADQMLERVRSVLKVQLTTGLLGGTFHRFANYALRKYGNFLGIPANFTIIDVVDATDVVDFVKTELGIHGKKGYLPLPKVKKIYEIISKAKNMELDIKAVVHKFYLMNLDYVAEIEAISVAFEEYKRKSNVLDYDDLMCILRDKLKANIEFRTKLQQSIDYVLVDEYQDTNNIQREIVELIAGDTVKITVVGDDAQSIYSFRGANFENILRFPKTFPNCGVVKLEENYRSQQHVLSFANEIIKNAKIGFKKKLYSRIAPGMKPLVRVFADGAAEAQYIVDKILEIKQNGHEYSDFSVLSRASWHSNYVQAELVKRNIPFVVVGGIKFSERRHVKDILAFLKIKINPLDAVAWHRILILIDGIGKVRANEIVEVIHSKQGVVDFSPFVNRKYYDELKQLEDLFEKLAILNQTPLKYIEAILDFYKPILKQIDDDYESRYKDLEVFMVIAQKYETLESFIEDFTLEPPSNRYQDATMPMTSVDEKNVVVSTIHSAKGLEWHTVFIPFALDGFIPSHKSLSTLSEIEEERRLFYVATTRAKENLYITMPSFVQSYNAVFTKSSRFITEVNSNHYDSEK